MIFTESKKELDIIDRSNLFVNVDSPKLNQTVVRSLITVDNLPVLIGIPKPCVNGTTFFQADRKSQGALSAVDKIRTSSTEDISCKEHNPIQSNLSAMDIQLTIKKILIVDDEPDIIFTLRTVFEEYPEMFKVTTYTNPVEVLGTFQANYYDLALIDINMPVLNGFQLCEKLVDLDANLRVCFMSGGEMNQDAIREIYPRISIGCFMKKPIGAAELIERVNSQLI